MSARPEPQGVFWKSEKNVNLFEVLRDDDDVIKWNTWQDNTTQTFVSVIFNRRTVITNPRTKYRHGYHIKLKWAPLIKYEQKCYYRELGVILTHPSSPFFHPDMGEWVRVYLQNLTPPDDMGVNNVPPLSLLDLSVLCWVFVRASLLQNPK